MPSDLNGELFSLSAGWTDVAPAGPFVVIADGRCPFTTDGLLALADLIDLLRSQRDSDEAVKRITPHTVPDLSPRNLTEGYYSRVSLVFFALIR